MSLIATFYPWDLNNIHILEFIYLIFDSDNQGVFEFFGYFLPGFLPFEIILIRNGQKSLYIRVKKITKIKSENNRVNSYFSIHTNAEHYQLDFDILKIIENRFELEYYKELIYSNIQIINGGSLSELSSDTVL